MAREYKDSGIEWIGQIPKEWEVRRIKTIFSERTEFSENGDETLLSVSEYYGVANRKEKIEDGDFVSRAESLVGYKKCYKGDLVSNIMLAWKGSLGVTNIDGIVSPAYCVYQPSKEVFPNYYHYLFRTSLFTSIFRLYSKGIIDSRLRLYSPFFFAISTLFPSYNEQQKIADYLDKVCGEVDGMVALQETMIEELKAYKQSVITETVTRGLNPSAPMRNSGIDWIGEIPEGWSLSKAKFFVDITNGSDPKTEGDIPVYGSGASSFKTCGEYKNGPTVLIGRKGATLHIPHYIEGKYWNVDTAFDVKVKDDFDLKYYYYIAICFDYKYYVSQTTLPGMAQSSYNNMQIPVPPMNEQCAIASYLDTMCSEIDSLIALKQAKIEELKEYKKSVIYEYVTGKKEVV